ncbi:hypothetical protein [Halobaculum sp. MBLA0143]|uniref:hypothetical protein n=1 Tax=Halobaculum sp. MBLA0143 TaxID=3079933 RepID=UPI00352653D5
MGRALDSFRAGVDRLDHWTGGNGDTVVFATLGLLLYVAEVVTGSDPAWYFAAPFVALLVAAFERPLLRRYRSWSQPSERRHEGG